MLCQNCKENEANVKYTQIINGVKKQMNLCDKCANELGINDISFNMPIDISSFLSDMFEEDTTMFMPNITKTLSCDKCNMTYEEFIKNGKFGCDECYSNFETKIDTLLKNIHGVNRHVGRNGKTLIENKDINKQQDKEIKNENDNEENKIKEDIKEKQNKIEELKARLKQEIREERYEDAAKTRDEIKRIEE